MSVTEYGAYGGQYVPETLMPALDELELGWREIRDDPGFAAELAELHRTYVGRPTPLYEARRAAGLLEAQGYSVIVSPAFEDE